MGILRGVVWLAAGVGISLWMALATARANRWVRLQSNRDAPIRPPFSRAARAVSAGLCTAGAWYLVRNGYVAYGLGMLAPFLSPWPVIYWHNARLFGPQGTSPSD
jgi:hypothetical protein